MTKHAMESDSDNINPMEVQILVFVMFTMRIMNLTTIHQCNIRHVFFIFYPIM